MNDAQDERAQDAAEAPPGAVLAAARVAEKLSVAEVARHLKLSVVQVEALEAGEFDRLPGPVFVRGFVRNYARLLKLDPEALLPRVEAELSPQPLSPETPPSKDIPFPPTAPRRWPLLALLALVVVGVLAVHEFYLTEPLPAPPRLTAPTPMPTPSPAPSPPAPAPAVTDEAPKVPAAQRPVVVDPGPPLPTTGARVAGVPRTPAPAAEPAAPAAAQAPQAPQAPQAQQAPEAPVAAGSAVVQLSFDDESWVEIRDRDGKVIFSQLNQPGTQRRVSGEPPLAVVIGNAHGVRLTYNERPVDLKRHTKVDVARFVLE